VSLRATLGSLGALVGKCVPEADDGLPVLVEELLVLLDPCRAERSQELLTEVTSLTVVGLGH
jgi:hypothetical protein